MGFQKSRPVLYYLLACASLIMWMTTLVPHLHKIHHNQSCSVLYNIAANESYKCPLLRRYSFSSWFMIAFFMCVWRWSMISCFCHAGDPEFYLYIYVNHDQQANSFSRHYACLNHDNKDFHAGDLCLYISANDDQNFVWKCTLCLRICSMRKARCIWHNNIYRLQG